MRSLEKSQTVVIYRSEAQGSQRTTVTGKVIAVELLGQDHGCPAEIGSIFVNGLTESELCDGESMAFLV